MEGGSLFITDPKAAKANEKKTEEVESPEKTQNEEEEKQEKENAKNEANEEETQNEKQEEEEKKENIEEAQKDETEKEGKDEKNENIENNEQKENVEEKKEEPENPPQSPPKPKPKPKPRPKKKPEPPPQPSLSDEEIETIIRDLLDGKSPAEYPSDTLSQTVNVLKLKKQNYIQEKKYIDAQRITKLTKDVLYYISKNSYSEQYEEKINQLTKKRDEAQRDLEELDASWQRKMDEFHQLVEDKVNAICEQNDQQLAEFDEKVQKQIDETVVRNSKELMDLKSKENGYVLNDMFVEAAKIRAKIDKFEEKMLEQEKAKKRDDADSKRRRIIETQITQLKVIEQWSNEKSIDMSRQMASEMLAAQNRVKNLNLQIEEAKKSATNPSIQKLHHAQRKSTAKRAGALVVPSVGNKRGPRKTSSRLK